LEDVLDGGDDMQIDPKATGAISKAAFAKLPTGVVQPITITSQAVAVLAEYRVFKALAAKGGRHGTRANYS
jgi:hypothetical protein